MNDEVNLDEVMARRFDLVEQASIIANRHKAELAPLNEELGMCEAFIKGEMLKSGMQQCKTGAGMAFFTTKDSCSVEDWDAVLAFIQDTGAWQLLNHAINKTAAREMIDAQTPPPGIKFDSYKDLAWRKGK